MRRRALLGGVSALAAANALAQPRPWPYGDYQPPYGPSNSANEGGGGASTDPTQDLDFTTGLMPPGISFTRNGVATYFDSTGNMVTAPAQTPRFDYDPGTKVLRGLLIEQASTNTISNSTMVGAVPGSPGTLPTNWVFSLQGIVFNVVGSGTESGIPFVDLRVSGTTTGTNHNLAFEVASGIAAVQNQTWTNSFYYKLAGGTLTNVNNIRAMMFTYTSALSLLQVPVGPVLTPTTGALATQRTTQSYQIPDATTAYVRPMMQINIASGVAVDFTLRIGAPQLELSTLPTSFVPTSTVAVLRGQDSVAVAGGAWLSPTTHTLETETIVPYSTLPAGISCPSAELDDGTNANSYVLRAAGPTNTYEARAFTANLTVGGSTGQTFAPWMVMKAISTFDSAGLAGTSVVNGGAPAPFTFTSAPVGLNRLAIGIGRSGLLNGWVRRVRYWPRLVSVSDMQSYTAPDPTYFDFTQNGSIDPRLVFARNSVATYFDATGTMQTAQANQPRQDFNPATGTMLGLLIEEQRTNSIKNSTNVGAVAGSPGTDPTGWLSNAIGGLTKTVVGVGVENGISYIDYRFNAAAGTGGNLNFVLTPTTTLSIPASAGQVYSMSVYLAFKAGSTAGLNPFTLKINQWDSGSVSLGPQSSTVFGLVPFLIGDPLTKTRVSFVFAATPANTAFIQPFFQLPVSAGAVDFTIRIGAVQLELGGMVTSFIPTSTVAVTRQADQPTVPTGPWFNPAASSLLGEYILAQAVNPTNNVRDVACLSDATVQNRLAIRGQGNGGLNQAQILSSVAGVATLTGGLGPMTALTALKVAGAWDGVTGTGAANGGAPLSYAGGIPSGITQLMFGNDTAATGNNINGWVRKVSYAPRAMAGSELQQITLADPVPYPPADLALDFTAGTMPPGVVIARASTATYFDVTGVMQTAASGAPRFDYDPVTHVPLGLLVERATANYAVQSGNMSVAPWTPQRATLAGAAAVAPDGTTTATRITEDTTAASSHYSGANVANIPVNAPITATVYLRDATRRWAQFVLYDQTTGTNNVTANIDLVAGTISAAVAGGVATAASTSITSVGGGWYRVAVTATLSATATTGVIHRVLLCNALGVPSYTGDGASSLFVWGAQVETTQYATSYFPTTAATGIRAADDVSIPVGAWFNAANSTLFGEFIYPRSADTAFGHDIAGLGDGSAIAGAPRMVIRAMDGFTTRCSYYSTASGTGVGGNLPAPSLNMNPNKIAAAFTAVNSYGALNGGAVITTVTGMPTGITLLAIGNQSPAGNSYLDAWVRKVWYWSSALSNAQLRTVTT
jgi:hypothetical protein